MVHGSEVSAVPNRSSLSAKGESAVRNLDCHPVVQAVRARLSGLVLYYFRSTLMFRIG